MAEVTCPCAICGLDYRLGTFPPEPGTQSNSPIAVNTPRTPEAEIPAANVVADVTAATLAGPAALPESLNVRQIPRKPRRQSNGDASAAEVITMPAPTPLPTLMTIATAVNAIRLWVSGTSNKLPARSSAETVRPTSARIGPSR